MKALFKKIRFFLHLLSAFFKKQRKIIILGILIGFSFFHFLPNFQKLFKKNLLRYGLMGKFSINELPLEIQNLLSQGLTRIAEDGSIYPELAESWEITNEGKEYIFTLKSNLFWPDHQPISAADVNYNFSDVATSILDSQKVKFELKEPFVPFIGVVSRPLFQKGLIGIGEYRVHRVKKNGEIVEKITLTPRKRSTLPTLVYHFYPTEETLRNAFKLGEVDSIYEITDLGELADWPEVKITPQIKYDRFVAIFFNTQTAPFDDKSIRQALAYAINKTWQPRALGPLNPKSWAYNPSVKPYQWDLINAKKLMENKAALDQIELSTIPSLLKTAEQIKKDWEELGITTKVKVISSLEEPFQALLATQEIPLDPDQYIIWHSTQNSNISGYKSPKIDKLLEDGRKTFDIEKRKEIYFEFQKTLVEDTAAIFLFHPTLYSLSRL